MECCARCRALPLCCLLTSPSFELSVALCQAQKQERIAKEAAARREAEELKLAMAREEQEKQNRRAAREMAAAKEAFAQAKRLEAQRNRSSRESEMLEVSPAP